jgi:hypothetical protein
MYAATKKKKGKEKKKEKRYSTSKNEVEVVEGRRMGVLGRKGHFLGFFRRATRCGAIR